MIMISEVESMGNNIFYVAYLQKTNVFLSIHHTPVQGQLEDGGLDNRNKLRPCCGEYMTLFGLVFVKRMDYKTNVI